MNTSAGKYSDLKYRIEEELDKSENKTLLMREVCKAANIERTTLWRYRRRKASSNKVIDYEIVKAISKSLNIHPDDFYRKNVKMSFNRA